MNKLALLRARTRPAVLPASPQPIAPKQPTTLEALVILTSDLLVEAKIHARVSCRMDLLTNDVQQARLHVTGLTRVCGIPVAAPTKEVFVSVRARDDDYEIVFPDAVHDSIHRIIRDYRARLAGHLGNLVATDIAAGLAHRVGYVSYNDASENVCFGTLLAGSGWKCIRFPTHEDLPADWMRQVERFVVKTHDRSIEHALDFLVST